METDFYSYLVAICRVVSPTRSMMLPYIRPLSLALSQVKQLNALLPIGSYCKKIRDDRDYWQSVEGYISQHTNAHFSHGICPECCQKELKRFSSANRLWRGWVRFAVRSEFGARLSPFFQVVSRSDYWEFN